MIKIKQLAIRLLPYLGALVGIAAAAALRYALGPVVGALIPVVIFTLPVVVSAVYGGFGPAMFATVISAVVADYLFLEPRYTFAISNPTAAVTIITFLLIGVTISLLGKRLKRLQAETRKQAQALAQENKMKDEFLAMLAHELRNPLAGISMAAELLKFGQLDAKRLGMAGSTITRQVEQMVKLIDDLLDVSRLTRGLVVIEKKPVDMSDVVHGAIDQTRSLIEKKGHSLDVRMPEQSACVLGDPTRLVQIVANFLNNAAKYTPEGGQIILTVHVKGTEVELSVWDNGAGLSPELLPHIFAPFVQGQRAVDRSQGGLGLGLAVVEKIAHMHEGSVSAYSSGLGQGSTFTVRLPNWKKPPVVGKQESSDQEEHRAKRENVSRSLMVLVVDDNRDAAHGLGAILESQGHNVSIAYNAKEALDFAHTDKFDAFLLDIGLPDVDGHKLAQLLRAMPQYSRATFIAVSGYGRPDDLDRSKNAGFHHHFVKPVGISKLSEALR